MKLSTMFLIIMVIQFNLILFDSGYTHETTFYNFVKNPQDWNASLLITVVGLIIAGAAITGSYVGSLIVGKHDLMIFAPLIALIVSWAIPIVSLWQVLYGEVGLFGSSNGWIASVFTAPLLILAIFSILGWWRGNSEM